MFLDCPAYLDQDGAGRCGLPAEVDCRFTMRSTDGPLESATIRCPVGHYFCGTIESLTWDGKDKHDPGGAAGTSRAGRDSVQGSHDGRNGGGGSHSGMSPPSRSVTLAARTPLPPTTWATLPPCGSPPCARAAGAPPLVTRWKPPSAAITQSRTPACSSTADSPAPAQVTAAARHIQPLQVPPVAVSRVIAPRSPSSAQTTGASAMHPLPRISAAMRALSESRVGCAP
jgi:hypothetical protein